MPSAMELLGQAKNAGSLGSLINRGVGGAILALSASLVSGILTVGDLVIKPLDAMADALAGWATALFGAPADLIVASADSTAQWLSGGTLGPFTFAAGVGSVLLAMWLVGEYRQEQETGNLLPGLPVDVPFIGQNEEGAD